MSPDQFLSQIARAEPRGVYLFLGPDSYRRERCRQSLAERFLPGEMREEGYMRHDLEESTLAEVIDDASSMSLFASRRLLWVSRAEAALPRGQASVPEGTTAALASYLGNPAPGVVIVFDCARYEFDGEDKAKLERVRKFYSAVPAVVEFPRFTPAEARRLAEELVRERGLAMGQEEIQLIVDTTGGQAEAIATEIEKLDLFAGPGKRITQRDIAQLAPHGEGATIFGLVAALGRKDRGAALSLLDTLVRGGEYLPLALSFLAAQFRQALAASESGLRGASQIQSHFQKMGVAMWPSRAAQVAQTAAAFTPAELRSALMRIAAADKALRDTRPDDRVVMEEFVLGLT